MILRRYSIPLRLTSFDSTAAGPEAAALGDAVAPGPPEGCLVRSRVNNAD